MNCKPQRLSKVQVQIVTYCLVVVPVSLVVPPVPPGLLTAAAESPETLAPPVPEPVVVGPVAESAVGPVSVVSPLFPMPRAKKISNATIPSASKIHGSIDLLFCFG